jgi:hypothetical protein
VAHQKQPGNKGDDVRSERRRRIESTEAKVLPDERIKRCREIRADEQSGQNDDG